MKRGIDDVDEYEHGDQVVAQASTRRRTAAPDESMMHTVLRTYDIDVLMRANLFEVYRVVENDSTKYFPDGLGTRHFDPLVAGNERVVEACRILLPRVPFGNQQYHTTLKSILRVAENKSGDLDRFREHRMMDAKNSDLISRLVLGIVNSRWWADDQVYSFDFNPIIEMIFKRDSRLAITSYGDTKYSQPIIKWLSTLIVTPNTPPFPDDFDLNALVLNVVYMYKKKLLIAKHNLLKLLRDRFIVEDCQYLIDKDPTVDATAFEVYLQTVYHIAKVQAIPEYVRLELEQVRNYGVVSSEFQDLIDRRAFTAGFPMWWTAEPRAVGPLLNMITRKTLSYTNPNVYCAAKLLKAPPLLYCILLSLYDENLYNPCLLSEIPESYWDQFCDPSTDLEWYRNAISCRPQQRKCTHYVGDRAAAFLILSQDHCCTANSSCCPTSLPQCNDPRYFSGKTRPREHNPPCLQYMLVEMITPQLVAGAVQNLLGHPPTDAAAVRDRVVGLLNSIPYEYVDSIPQNWFDRFSKSDGLYNVPFDVSRLELWITHLAMSLPSNTRFKQSMFTLMRYFVAFKCVPPEFGPNKIGLLDKSEDASLRGHAWQQMHSLAYIIFHKSGYNDKLLPGCVLMNIDNAGSGDWTTLLPRITDNEPSYFRYTPSHGFLVNACSLDIPMDVMQHVVDDTPDTTFACDLLKKLLTSYEWRTSSKGPPEDYYITENLAKLFGSADTLGSSTSPPDSKTDIIGVRLLIDLLVKEPYLEVMKETECIQQILDAIPQTDCSSRCLTQLVVSCGANGLAEVYEYMHADSVKLSDDKIWGQELRVNPVFSIQSIFMKKKNKTLIDLLFSMPSFTMIVESTFQHMIWNWASTYNMRRHMTSNCYNLYYTIDKMRPSLSTEGHFLIHAALLTYNRFTIDFRQTIRPMWVLDSSLPYCEEYEMLLTGQECMVGAQSGEYKITKEDNELAFNILVACRTHLNMLVSEDNIEDKFEESVTFSSSLASNFDISNSRTETSPHDDPRVWVGPYTFLWYFYEPFTSRALAQPERFLEHLFQALETYTVLDDLDKDPTNQALARVLLRCDRAAALKWWVRSNRSSSVQIGQSIIVKGTLPALTTIVANDFSPVQYQRSFKLSDQWMHENPAEFGEYVAAAKLYDAGFPTVLYKQYEMEFDPSAVVVEGGELSTVGRYKKFDKKDSGKERQALDMGMEYFRGVRRPEEGWMCLYRGSSIEDRIVTLGTKIKVMKPMSTSTSAAIAYHYYTSRRSAYSCMMQILVHPDIPLIYLTAINLGQHEILIHPVKDKVLWLKCVHERAISESDITSASLRVSNSDQNLDSIILRTYLLTFSDVQMVPDQVVEIYHNESFHADAMLPLWKTEQSSTLWSNVHFDNLNVSLCEWVLGGAQEVVNGIHTTFSDEPESGVNKEYLPSVREAVEMHNTRLNTGSTMKSGVCFWAPGVEYYLTDEQSSSRVLIPGYGLFTVPPANFSHPVFAVSIAGNKGYALIQGYTPESFPCIWVLHRPRVLGEFGGRELPAALFTGDNVPSPEYTNEQFEEFQLMGRGGYGEVRQRTTEIVVKTSFSELKDSKDRFRCDYGTCDNDLVLEAHVMSTLSVYRSPYFPVYHGLFNRDHKLYLESSKITGITIGEYLRSTSDEISQRKLLFHLLYALYETRDSKFMHRDLNLNNVIVRQNTGWREDEPQLFAVGNMTFSVPCDTMPVMIDFGLSRINKGNLSFTYSEMDEKIGVDYNIWWEVVGLFRPRGNSRGSAPYARGTWFHMTEAEERSEDWTPEKMLLSERVWKANDMDM